MEGFRLFIYSGDTQDFTDLDACLTEARKVLDPAKITGASVTIEHVEDLEDA